VGTKGANHKVNSPKISHSFLDEDGPNCIQKSIIGDLADITANSLNSPKQHMYCLAQALLLLILLSLLPGMFLAI